MRVADAIADWLAEKKIVTAFGIIGGGNVVLFDAIQAKGSTRIVCTHHEQAAAMASCYHNRTTGSLSSVVLCTTGAGSTNTITGVMAAYMDSIPLLVISGNDPWKYMYAKTRVWGTQAYGSSEVAKGFTKHSERFDGPFIDAGHVHMRLTVARTLATDARQGPVWVDICKDVQNADCR